MKNHIKALRSAFPHTIPVLSGYIVLGAAYGILMHRQGISLFWIAFSSIFIYAGSMQFVSVALLSAGFDYIGAFLMTLMVNARHLFYSISFLQKYKNMGNIKPYLVLSLTDETFSLLCSATPPDGISPKWFYFYISLLNHIYWVTGSVLGGILGVLMNLETNGLEFALTALFIVIFIDQWKMAESHIPALIGIFGAVACRIIFGASDFIIPSMAVILLVLTIIKKPLEKGALK